MRLDPAPFILKYRLWLILLLLAYAAFMGYQGTRLQMSYSFGKVVPADDPDLQYYQAFREQFGEDGNVLAIGLQDSSVFELENFRRLKYFADAVEEVAGVEQVVALPRLLRLARDNPNRTFRFDPLFDPLPDTQAALDSLLDVSRTLKFYEGRLLNDSTQALAILVTLDAAVLNSEDRFELLDDVLMLGREFTDATGIRLHYAGLPFVRAVMTTKVKKELNFFLILSVVVTAVILFVFFRALNAVVFPLIVIGITILSTMGTLALFGYQVTLLTGLLPPILVVIAVPNCIYLINKYHLEFAKHGDQTRALQYVIRRIGVVTLLTNATTAVGFLVLAFTNIAILREFGVAASLNVFVTFVVSIIFIPAVYAYMPPPNRRHLRHLEFKATGSLIRGLDILVSRHPLLIFCVTGLVVVVSLIGALRIKAISYMVDDLPAESEIRQDLAFFERNFVGVMPFEVVIDTGKPKGALDLKNLRTVDELNAFLSAQPEIAPSISVVDYLKAARQAFYNDNPAFYGLPTNQDKNFILSYLSRQSQGAGSTEVSLQDAFVDSTGQQLRLSFKVQDVGSVRLDALMEEVVRPGVDSLLLDTGLEATVTGTTLLFIKGNDYLIRNLRSSLLIAIGLIGLIMAALFGNFRMILISLVPNLVPLLITAGLMGYFNIPLKPSTALIFSIAFGISVDDSLHFLAKYRQELRLHGHFVPKAVSVSILETGPSMLYTSLVLFAGFVIFSQSEFGGTVALGVLVSTTLLFAMLANLVLLPTLLLYLDRARQSTDFEPLIEHYEDFYHAGEDEEIDLDRIGLGGERR
ncbi:MAG: MMPL family transporter [Catalinimonas sp.]